MTDQRKVTTDPGLGPVQREHASTLRSMTAADPIPEDEIPGVPVYYEPKPLHAVSDHKTLELETVKLAKDIDPRKLPTELKLRRPVLHVLPASDPNWPAPAPAPQLEVGATPLFDSNWPPPETVLTTSHPPLAPRRRSFVPLVLLVVLAACFVLVLGARRMRHRAAAPAVAVQAVQPAPAAALVAAAAPTNVEPVPSASSAPEPSEAASASAVATTDAVESPDTADAPDTAESPAAATTAASAEPAASAAPARADAHHPPFKATSSAIANSPALNAPPPAKPKRAIY